jgi:hypothetical protein
LRSFGQGAVLITDGSSGQIKAAVNENAAMMSTPLKPSKSSSKRRLFANPLTWPRYVLKTLGTVFHWGICSAITDVARLVFRVLLPGWVCFIGHPYRALRERWALNVVSTEVAGQPSGSSQDGNASNAHRAHASTSTFLRSYVGLTSGFLTEFLEPFFEAIYVSPLSSQHPAIFEFVLRMLAVPGSASLPEEGINAIACQLLDRTQQLAKKSANGSSFNLFLSTPVSKVLLGDGDADVLLSSSEKIKPAVLLSSGEKRTFDKIVIATEWPAALELVGSPATKDFPVHATTSETLYFGLPEAFLPVREPLIVLNGTNRDSALFYSETWRICNIGFPSVVQQSYAPKGQHLCAVTLMRTGDPDPSRRDTPPTEMWVREELSRLLGPTDYSICNGDVWRLLQRVPVKFHQPGQAPGTLQSLVNGTLDSSRRDVELGRKGVELCGDWRGTPTLDGAMLSGRLAAERVLKTMIN